MILEKLVNILFVMSLPKTLRIILTMLAMAIYFVVRKDKDKRRIVVVWFVFSQFISIYSLETVRNGVGYTKARIEGRMSEVQSSQASLEYLLSRWERVVFPDFSLTIVIWVITLIIALLVLQGIRFLRQRLRNLG